MREPKRSRSAALLAIAACLALAGCADPSGPSTPTTLRVGDHARYSSEDFEGVSAEIHVDGPVLVKDGSRTTEAWLLLRWVNFTADQKLAAVDAVSLESGDLIWSAACVGDSLQACGTDLTYYMAVRGTPSWIKRPTGSGCLETTPQTVQGSLGFLPPFFSSGWVWCNEAFPSSMMFLDLLNRPSEWTLEATTLRSGPAVSTLGSDLPPPVPIAAPSAASGTRFPPGPSFGSELFPIQEAWEWVAANDAGFKRFVEAHPDTFVNHFETAGGGLSGVGPGLVGPMTTETFHQRSLQIASASEAGPSWELEKHCFVVLSESRCEITASPGDLDWRPGVDPQRLPAMAVSHADATRAGLDLVGGTWMGTDILTQFTAPAESFFAYRVKAIPPEADADSGFLLSVLRQVVVRSDTGQTIFVVGPASIGWA